MLGHWAVNEIYTLVELLKYYVVIFNEWVKVNLFKKICFTKAHL